MEITDVPYFSAVLSSLICQHQEGNFVILFLDDFVSPSFPLHFSLLVWYDVSISDITGRNNFTNVFQAISCWKTSSNE